MRQLGTISLIVCLAAASGCNICCWGKRATELTGPTDIRQSHYWCLGEDAVFAQPMGPSGKDYGLKPTCWREWPADGARCVDGSQCADGSCGPTMPLSAPGNGDAPNRQWQPSHPGENGPQINPFEDDLQSLPTPAGQGAQRRQPTSRERASTTQQASSGLLFDANPVSIRRAAGPYPTTNVAPRKSPAPRLIATPSAQPAAPKLQAPRQAASNEKPPLKITVSDPIDTPVQFQAPAESTPAPVRLASATTAGGTEFATLASLEKMIEVPVTDTPPASGPLVVQNDFAAQPQPFRLATRATVAEVDDKEAERKTLSALGTMMSVGTPSAGANR